MPDERLRRRFRDFELSARRPHRADRDAKPCHPDQKRRRRQAFDERHPVPFRIQNPFHAIAQSPSPVREPKADSGHPAHSTEFRKLQQCAGILARFARTKHEVVADLLSGPRKLEVQMMHKRMWPVQHARDTAATARSRDPVARRAQFHEPARPEAGATKVSMRKLSGSTTRARTAPIATGPETAGDVRSQAACQPERTSHFAQQLTVITRIERLSDRFNRLS